MVMPIPIIVQISVIMVVPATVIEGMKVIVVIVGIIVIIVGIVVGTLVIWPVTV
jgi:hypothetical protein